MKRSYSFFILSFFLLALLAAGCSKKDDSNPVSPVNNGNNNTPPAVPTVNLKGPASTSKDANLFIVKGYIQSLNAFMSYSNLFQNVEAAYSDSTWVRKYVNGSITATLTTTRLTDGSYSWKLTLSGTSDSVVYNNWLALEGTSSADGKTGTWKVYRQNTNILSGDYSWQMNPDGSVIAVLREYESGEVLTRVEVTENADKSGQVLVYTKSNLSYKALWQSNGSGQWWLYDSKGSILHQGIWS